MNQACEPISPWEEHRFWLEILDDHSVFVRDFLSPTESHWVALAQQYSERFRYLLGLLAKLPSRNLPIDDPAMIEFARVVYPVAEGYYRLEGTLQNLRLTNRVNLNATPTYFNGTLNENQEYLRFLSYAQKGQPFEELSLVALLHLWIEDQLGHAILLNNVLDPVEIPLATKALGLAQAFRNHMAKNQSIAGYLRFSPPGLPFQQRFAREVSQTVAEFYSFVVQIIGQFANTELLSRTTLRFLEHHLPETCYFLRKLSCFNPEIVMIPYCSLTKPTLYKT
ncbi:DUF2935 family protein [Paenibacillus sp. BK033]|uniref:DUF2935 domain-containing protein n=1 Tax=Paenibacillus sp. BK033 TaxID=2512133 RepID=UPI001049ABF4|nr:DUF2935 domain-containing protein [Paenibacillus sp. BK033]TCM90992.1 DUF2935 family protein [Paenibacillus sp. BK033]